MMSSIMCSLDSLFDTRYTLLTKLAGYVDIESYLTRSGDNFRYIGGVFKSLYGRRSKSLLKGAKLTPIFDIILILEKEIYAKLISEESLDDVYLDINIYPYKLTKEEIAFIDQFVKEAYVGNVTVRVVDEEPTVKLYSRYAAVIDYNGFEIINNFMMSGSLTEGELIYTKVIVPDNVDDPAIYKKHSQELYLEAIMKVFSIYVNLQFIDKAMFSVRYVKEKKE